MDRFYGSWWVGSKVPGGSVLRFLFSAHTGRFQLRIRSLFPAVCWPVSCRGLSSLSHRTCSRSVLQMEMWVRAFLSFCSCWSMPSRYYSPPPPPPPPMLQEQGGRSCCSSDSSLGTSLSAFWESECRSESERLSDEARVQNLFALLRGKALRVIMGSLRFEQLMFLLHNKLQKSQTLHELRLKVKHKVSLSCELYTVSTFRGSLSVTRCIGFLRDEEEFQV